MASVKFAGIEVDLGGEKFIVPAIALGKLKELQPRLAELDLSDMGALSPGALDTVSDLILAALNRNYPDMTRAQLDDLLDLGNLGDVVKIVTGQSGLVEKKRELSA
jgi:hypothetical protein